MASPSGPRPAPARGVLRDVPVAHALVYLRDKRLTGTYEVRAPDDRQTHVLFWRGRLADAVLLARADDETRVVENASPENRIRDTIDRLFGWPPSSTFAFREVTIDDDATEPHLLVDPLASVWRGVAAHPDPMRVRETLARLASSSLVVVSEIIADRAELDDDERALCEAIAASPATPDVVLASPAAEKLGRERAELLVYFLVLAQAIEPVAAHVARPSGTRALSDVPPAPPSFRLRQVGGTGPAVASRATRTPEELGVEGIRLRASRIGHETAYEALGLDGGASPEEVRAAYFRLARAWNPSRLAPELAEAQADVARVHAWLSRALRAILDAKAAGG